MRWDESGKSRDESAATASAAQPRKREPLPHPLRPRTNLCHNRRMATADADDDATLDTLDGTHRRTLLYDAMGYVGDQIAEIREEIAREMRNTPATAEMPGAAAKVPVTLAPKNIL